MSRLSALKEYAFMKVLRENGFRVPEPVAQSRHTVVMELVDAFPLRQINEVPDPAGLYAELIDVVLRLASFGLIHGDFNEFNILIREDESPKMEGETPQEPEANDSNTENPSKSSITLTPVIIDFPQMVSIDHANAEMYFDRDVNCIKRFFERRFNFVSDESGPFFADVKKLAGGKKGKRLDIEVEASGFSKKMAKELEKYMREIGVDGNSGHDEGDQSTEDDSEASDGPSEAQWPLNDSTVDTQSFGDMSKDNKDCEPNAPFKETIHTSVAGLSIITNQ